MSVFGLRCVCDVGWSGWFGPGSGSLGSCYVCVNNSLFSK